MARRHWTRAPFEDLLVSARCARSFALIFISWVHGLRRQFTRITIYLYATFTSPSPTVYINTNASTRANDEKKKQRNDIKQRHSTVISACVRPSSSGSSVYISTSVRRTRNETAHDMNTTAIWTYELALYVAKNGELSISQWVPDPTLRHMTMMKIEIGAIIHTNGERGANGFLINSNQMRNGIESNALNT